ncbi:hypothetical protein GCM10009753_77940 [Streptantibioticus ferralitis]
MPSLADLALGAGHLPAVEVDVGVVPAGVFILAVLTGGVARQRPGDRDLVFPGGLFQVDRGGVAAVDEVLGGQQTAELETGVDTGKGLGVVCGGRGGGHVRDYVGEAPRVGRRL